MDTWMNRSFCVPVQRTSTFLQPKRRNNVSAEDSLPVSQPVVLSGAFPTAHECSVRVVSADKGYVLVKWGLVAAGLHRLFLSAHRLL